MSQRDQERKRFKVDCSLRIDLEKQWKKQLISTDVSEFLPSQEKALTELPTTPFVAMWMRAPTATEAVARRLPAYGVTKTSDGKFVCVCGSHFAGPTASQECATCWLRHGVATLDAAVEAAVPSSSESRLGGRWLDVGEECSACGNRAGGWICSGSHAHVASCEEALLVEGRWSRLRVTHAGELEVDCKTHCVHLDGTFKMRDGAFLAVLSHLAGHNAASKHYHEKMKAWAKTVGVEQRPVIAGNFLAREGPAAAEFSARVRAFTRNGQRMPAGEFLQHLVCEHSDGLASVEPSHVKYRKGSVVLPDPAGDGFVILRVDWQRKMVETGVVHRNDACARHPRCVCFTIDQYEKQWRHMKDIKGKVVCLAPRFGWKHDFTLDLSKVCWQRADPRASDGSTDDGPSEAVVEPGESSVTILRCAKLLQLCRVDMQLQPCDYPLLRFLGSSQVNIVTFATSMALSMQNIAGLALV